MWEKQKQNMTLPPKRNAFGSDSQLRAESAIPSEPIVKPELLPSLEEVEAMRRLIEKYETILDFKIVELGAIDDLVKAANNSRVITT